MGYSKVDPEVERLQKQKQTLKEERNNIEVKIS